MSCLCKVSWRNCSIQTVFPKFGNLSGTSWHASIHIKRKPKYLLPFSFKNLIAVADLRILKSDWLRALMTMPN